MTSRAQPVRRTAALAAMAVVAIVAVACGGDSDDLPPPASPAPVTSLTPDHEPEILDVFHGAIEAMVIAQRAGDPDHPDLLRYFIERTPALIDVQGSIRQNDSQGWYYTGDLAVVTADVTDIDMDAGPPSATISACVDYTNYQLANREDDSPVSGAEPLGLHPVTSQAIYGTDSNWYIATSSTDWDATC